MGGRVTGKRLIDEALDVWKTRGLLAGGDGLSRTKGRSPEALLASAPRRGNKYAMASQLIGRRDNTRRQAARYLGAIHESSSRAMREVKHPAKVLNDYPHLISPGQAGHDAEKWEQ